MLLLHLCYSLATVAGKMCASQPQQSSVAARYKAALSCIASVTLLQLQSSSDHLCVAALLAIVVVVIGVTAAYLATAAGAKKSTIESQYRTTLVFGTPQTNCEAR
eukprot:12184-Heterococcus_DN1.PRE.3